MKMKYTAFLMAFFIAGLVSAQENQTRKLSCEEAFLQGVGYQGSLQAMNQFVISDMRGSASIGKSLTAIKGSPYLVATFQKAALYYDDKAIGSVYARYNAYAKEMEVKKTNLEEEKYMALAKDERLKIVFRDKQLQYVGLIDEKGKKHDDYLISMKDGNKYGVYERLIVNYKEGREAENSMVTNVPDRFTKTTEFYLKDNTTNIIAQLPNKKSKLLKLFSEKERVQVAELIKKNKLNLKEANDLVKICDFLNTTTEDYAMGGE